MSLEDYIVSFYTKMNLEDICRKTTELVRLPLAVNEMGFSVNLLSFIASINCFAPLITPSKQSLMGNRVTGSWQY